jgi:hypothetical protein
MRVVTREGTSDIIPFEALLCFGKDAQYKERITGALRGALMKKRKTSVSEEEMRHVVSNVGRDFTEFVEENPHKEQEWTCYRFTDSAMKNPAKPQCCSEIIRIMCGMAFMVMLRTFKVGVSMDYMKNLLIPHFGPTTPGTLLREANF